MLKRSGIDSRENTMSSWIDLIGAIGELGLVAAIATIVGVWVSRHFDLKRLDRENTHAIAKEDRDFNRALDKSIRDIQLQFIFELQDVMFPLQEQASNLQWIGSRNDELVTGRPAQLVYREEHPKYQDANNRVEILTSRLMDEELSNAAELCRADAYYMVQAKAGSDEVDRHRQQFIKHYRQFQGRARVVIHELLAQRSS